MSSNWRRFEVLLPLQFNDGREVPPEWLAEAVLEIVERFGADGWHAQSLRWAYALCVELPATSFAKPQGVPPGPTRDVPGTRRRNYEYG
jgi:hypothetical protein